ncbi:unnamed protein product [Mytilus coruscus]|uniref:Uncharacterized protein n=1 Tax=Mytilus coruscus TaxID=42192 RepID=A0A6J8BUV2_MYTCO|nr:unnamed protein product [Mytilus coruscus]
MQDDTQMSQLNMLNHMTCRIRCLEHVESQKDDTQMSQLNHMTCRMVEEKLLNSPFQQKNQQNQRQIYRINLYNTTCRAEINGRNHQQIYRINLYNTTCRAEINGRNHQQIYRINLYNTTCRAEINGQTINKSRINKYNIAEINGRNHQQIYRINLYNTTCRAEINGRNHQQFFSELQTIATKMDVIKDYSVMNEAIRNECLKHAKASPLHEPNNMRVSDSCIKTKARPNSNTLHDVDQSTSNLMRPAKNVNAKFYQEGSYVYKVNTGYITLVKS